MQNVTACHLTSESSLIQPARYRIHLSCRLMIKRQIVFNYLLIVENRNISSVSYKYAVFSGKFLASVVVWVANEINWITLKHKKHTVSLCIYLFVVYIFMHIVNVLLLHSVLPC